MTRHPANRGLVMLAAWVEPALRDHVRARAKERGEPLSAFVTRAVLRAIQQHDLDRLAAGGTDGEEWMR